MSDLIPRSLWNLMRGVRSLGVSWGVIVILCCVGGAQWWSAAWRSAEHLKTARQWEAKGELRRALHHYQWAARAYSPGSNTGERALKRLWELARAQREDDPKFALYAYDLMRGAVRSTRWLLSPYETWREPIDAEIIAIRASQVTPRVLTSLSRAELERRLTFDPRPSPIRSLALLIATIAVMTSLVWFIRAGLTAQLKLTPHAWRSGLMSVISWISLWSALSL